MSKDNLAIKGTVIVTYLGMLVTNVLANALPINGVGTGAVSDAYENLFAPAGITFAIWGVIYLLLLVYSFFQLGIILKESNEKRSDLIKNIGILFSISSLANIVWIFSWHYDQMVLALILIVVMLLCLIFISQITRKEDLSLRERFFIKTPFSIYFGWITVATIANVVVVLVKFNWGGLGISPALWTMLILGVGTLIGIATMLRNRDLGYGLVFLWAYGGIIIKHTTFFEGAYPSVIMTAGICMGFFLVAGAYLMIRSRKKGTDILGESDYFKE